MKADAGIPDGMLGGVSEYTLEVQLVTPSQQMAGENSGPGCVSGNDSGQQNDQGFPRQRFS